MGSRNYHRRREDTHREQDPLRILPVAEDLIDYTLDVTDNAKRYPKKVRFTFVDRIQNIVLEVYDDLLAANEIFPIWTQKDKADRLTLQRNALTACKRLLFFVKLSKKRHYIDEGAFDTWTSKVLDVKVMAAAWYNAEQATQWTPPEGAAQKVDSPADAAGGNDKN